MFKRRRRRAAGDGATDGAIEGIARLDARTKRLIGRLQPGEIAVIDHDDLDRVAAESLVERKVRAVINAAESSTGQYPNLGPLVLLGAGVPLIDGVGPDAFAKIRDGARIRIEDGRILVGDEVAAKGTLMTMEAAQERFDESKREISAALERFAENTLQYMVSERELLVEARRLPKLDVDMAGRHVLVVARGYRYKEDLASLSSSGYLRDFRPVLIAVDGGADALLDLKLKPDVIIGDSDSVTTHALTCGAELVQHVHPDGRAPGRERLEALGLKFIEFVSDGTSEDVALLLAHEEGAELIVAVGARASLIEFMDKGRKGMASTFLVRLRVGSKLVDAKGVSELHRPGPTRLQLISLVVAALVTMIIVAELSPVMKLILHNIPAWFKGAWFALTRAVG